MASPRPAMASRGKTSAAQPWPHCALGSCNLVSGFQRMESILHEHLGFTSEVCDFGKPEGAGWIRMSALRILLVSLCEGMVELF